jgi:hypothetical protein
MDKFSNKTKLILILHMPWILHIYIYYMDSGILLGTKTLVELIRHYIRDTVRVFSVCHA